MRFANEAVNRWANYDGTYWKPLFSTLQGAVDGSKTLSTGVTAYTAPSNFKEAGGFLKVLDSDGGVKWNYPILEPQDAQFKADTAHYCYFTTNPVFYSTGTVSQSATTITGSGTTFTADMVGMEIRYASGETATITAFTSATSLTASVSQTVSSTTYQIITQQPTLNINPAPTSDLNGLEINYIYYAKPTLYTSGESISEVPDPYFVVNRMLAQRFRASRNPYYNSALRDAEDCLRMMKLDNDSGTWSNPWQVPDRSGSIWGIQAMPLQIPDDTPTQFPELSYLTLDNFKRGVITLIDESRLPKNALKEADNIYLYEDGQPGPRPGVDWFGTAPSNDEIDGFDYFDNGGEVHLVVAAGGTIYRSLDDGENWTACTGATYTAGNKVNMNQYNAYLYLTNGVDNIIRYDGSTTLLTYSGLSTPAAPSIATGLTGTGYSYYYKTARVNSIGFSIASSASSAVTTSLPRSAWDSTSNFVTITPDAWTTGQERTDIYISEDNVYFYYLSSVTTTNSIAGTFKDDGSAIISPGTTAPTASTASGPKVEELVNVGSRMYGIRDTANRYRIWFTSGSAPFGSFSTAYDGGYLDWTPGGKFVPVQVADYRDGKGTPYATIWCKSADGQGCILQMSLDVFTVDDISVTVPAAYKLPGSRGTPSPGSVVNVLNDYMFYNSQAFYNLGSRVNFQNLLSTDEASANIRPTVKQISTAGEADIASVYFDAKVLFSVPYGSSTNNYTAVYDTERRAWLPTAFTIGFKKFLRYTDTDGGQRLLAVKPGDSRLSYIDYSVLGDYGDAFTTSLVTGLYPINRNRFEFQWTEEGEIEFSNPQGTINIELLGIERSRGFRATNSETIQSRLTNTGWSTEFWSAYSWSDTSDAVDTYSESSIKRYFNVQKELNAIQWRITSADRNAHYILRTLQINGTATQSGKPRQWKLQKII